MDKIIERVFKLIVSSLILLLVVACATSSPIATPEKDLFLNKFQAPSDKSLIILVRPWKMHGRLSNIPPIVDRHLIGNLKNGSYVLVDVVPGKHSISVPRTFEGDRILELNTEAGQIYFIEMSMVMGWTRQGIKIKLISEDTGKRLARKCNLIETP